jgi:hypothetical protein
MLTITSPLELAMNQSSILEQRRQARAEKHLVDATLIELHVKACDALSNASAGNGVRERALQQVARWESAHLCDMHYADAWRNILNLPLASIRPAMLRNDAEGIALRQNSPFGFLINHSA